nr:MAG TPA: helix-turn-helix domain protein [Caudoviricetes sp.]
MDRILDILNEKKLTKTAFADLVGVKNQNVNAMLKNPTRETYERIAAALGVPLWQLFASPEEVKGGNAPKEDIIHCPNCGAKLELKKSE